MAMRPAHRRRRSNLVVGLIMLIGAAAVPLPQTVNAQQLRGVVRDSLARPLAGAEVILSSNGDRVRSDSLGRFLLSLPFRTTDTLRVRLIGYRPFEQQLAGADSSRALVVVLRRYPQMLDTVRARTDQDRCSRAALSGFECRRAAGRVDARPPVGSFEGLLQRVPDGRQLEDRPGL
jgi:hypothetical protein